MISLDQYFTNPTTGEVKPHTDEHEENARDLLERREALRAEYYEACGVGSPDVDRDTGSEISGSKGGSGDGGFRLSTSTTGAAGSPHKDALAVDDSDQDDAFDKWLDKFESPDGRKNSMLEKHGLYREHPSKTPTWCHLTTRAPKSGKRTFFP